MRLGLLLGFVPDEILLLLIMLVILAYVLDLVPASFFFGALLIFILIYTPLLDNLLGGLSLGWWILIWMGVVVAFVRGALGLLLGQRVADGLISHLLRDVVVFPFKVAGGMIGMIFTSLRNRLSHRLGGRIA